MDSKRNLLFQGSIFRFHVSIFRSGFKSCILQVNVTCYHGLFCIEGNAPSKKLWSNIMRSIVGTSICHRKKIRQPLTFPTLHLTLKKHPWNKNPAEKKTSSPFGRRRRLTSPLHQRNWSAWQSRAASAGLSAIKFISGFGSLDVPRIPTYPYGWNP